MKIFILVAASLVAAATPRNAADSTPATAKVQPVVGLLRSLIPSAFSNQILGTWIQPNAVNYARNTHITRDGTTLKLLGEKYTMDGANVYWLGLDENVIPAPGAPFYAPYNASYPTHGRITEIMNTMVMMGMKIIRSQTLGVSTGNPLSLMPKLGEWNEKAFDTIDWSVYQARQHGLRIIVPLTDNYNYYHGGKFNFLQWRGFNITGSENPLPQEVQEFYTNRQVINDFKTYVEKLITHVNPYTGISYAQDPTIMAYETGNELGGPRFKDKNVPTAWTREICQLVKKLGPKKLCSDGTYGVNPAALSLSEVDIYSNHYYPLNITIMDQDVKLTSAAKKVYYNGEIDWTGLNGGRNPGDKLVDFYKYILNTQKENSYTVGGSLIWSLFGRNVPDCSTYVPHGDKFTMHYNNPENSAFNNSQISTVRQNNFKMQGIDVDSYNPAVPCPGGKNFIPGYEAEYTYY